MEEREQVISIVKSNNPEELIVFRAVSLPDEIRFYLNPIQYVVAKENEDNIQVEIKEEVEEKQKRKHKLNKKDILWIILVSAILSVITIGVTALALLISKYLNSMIAYFMILNTFFFLFDICRVVVLEAKTTPTSLKSKHSAEHMMVNFLEKNKRLPKNMKEIKKASRFCNGCGSRELIKGIAEDFVSKTFASILAVVASTIYCTFFSNVIVDLIIFTGVYFGVLILLQVLLKKYNKFSFLINPIRNGLTRIAQSGNTTKNVKDDDIYLTYLAAREWMQIVYPEFYNEQQDVFLDNIE